MDSLVLEVWRIMVILSLPALTQCSPLFVMSAPNLLRVGAPERVFVEAQDYAGSAFEVTVRVQDYPYKTRELANQTVQLRQDNNYQALAEITIPEGNDVFEEDDTVNQYVYLLAQFPGQLLERVVLVSFQSGYIFVQTDKTIYTPSSTVLYRIYTLGLSMRPSDRPITVDVVDPEGVVVSRDALTPHEGVCSGAYKVQAFDSIGSWKIVTRFKSTPQNNFTYEFKVKNYVLPQVEVTLAPLKSYFYIDDEELIVNISARYLNKMEVTGMGFVVFSLQGLGTDYRHIASTQRVKITGGRGHATLTRERLLQVTPGTADIQHLTGTFIHVNVTVVTQTGYDTAYASISGIQIVTSPYTIHYKKTPRYFKPGMPFTCMIFVTNPDGSPAEGVEVQISNKKSSEISGITRTNGLVKLTVNTDKKDSLLLINAVTKDRNLTDARQARQSMTAFPYETKAGSENYLHIDIDATELTIGDPVKVNLILRGSPGDQNQDLTCLILSKGQLVSAGRAKPEGKAVVSLTLTVTKDMVPSFRIVAYYHVGSSEVVSDSVWVDVKDTCREKLKVRPYRPGEAYVRKIFSLEITGDPGARVGLVVVDKGVYMLNNKHRLTQTKIWNTVEKLDAGCTAGSGKDSMGVFYDAGLLFETSTAGGTHSRTGSHCPSPRRRQRSLEDEEEVMAIFDDVISRSHFQESFFWQEEQLPTCEHGEKQCASTSIRKDIVVTDAIAGWHISAVSLSDTSGICVADALDISKAASFSLDLKVPPFCKCNEQLEIIAIVHNPEDEDMRVHLKLVETPTICSSATDRGGYVTTVEVRARTTNTVPFVIVPMETGTQSVVVAAADAFWRTDGVQKDIVVLPVGVPRRTTVKFDMNPSVSGGYLTSVIGPWLIGVYDPIPNMPVHHIITAQAQPLVSRMEAVLSGDSVAPLLLRSGRGGGGEQDLVAMTTPLIANYYLDRTQQLLERRAEAVSIIRAGYHRLLTYRKQDGSFSVSKTTQSSTWLTAYVAKVFSIASGIISVDGQAICSALLWLVAQTQNPDGSFQELSPVPYTVSSTGNVYGKDRDASMTAFVLAAMQESPSALCTDKKITSSISRATHYLGLRIHTLTNPYAVAMASYALANGGLLHKGILFRHSATGGIFWPVPGNHLFTVEATAYALLALVKAGEFEKAGPIVNWLRTQQRHGGGYGSTQATLMVYQALAEYTTQGRLRQRQNTSLEVTLNMADRTAPVTWTFTRGNALLQRSAKVRLDRNMTVTARGNGRGILSVTAMYYSLPKREEGCHKFKLDLSFQKLPQGSDSEALDSYLLTVDVMVKTKDSAPSAAILNIGILTGFAVDSKDLQKLTANKTRDIGETSLSQGNIVVHLNEVPALRPERFALHMRRTASVGLLQPAGVSVRDYSSQETGCLKFYHPQKPDGALGLICEQHVCKCAAESCGVQMRQGAENVSRHDVSCRQFRDYVYKVTVEAVQLSSLVDTYHMRVTQVVKQGTDIITKGASRQFLSVPQCRQGLDLTVGKTYLIIGRSKDLLSVHDGFHYVLSKHSWVEYWPTDSEGQTAEFKSRYMAIQQFAQELSLIGCQL